MSHVSTADRWRSTFAQSAAPRRCAWLRHSESWRCLAEATGSRKITPCYTDTWITWGCFFALIWWVVDWFLWKLVYRNRTYVVQVVITVGHGFQHVPIPLHAWVVSFHESYHIIHIPCPGSEAGVVRRSLFFRCSSAGSSSCSTCSAVSGSCWKRLFQRGYCKHNYKKYNLIGGTPTNGFWSISFLSVFLEVSLYFNTHPYLWNWQPTKPWQSIMHRRNRQHSNKCMLHGEKNILPTVCQPHMYG